MSSPRYIKLTMPGNGSFSTSFNLEEARVSQFKKRLLELDVKAGSHAETEAMKRLLGRNDLEKAQKEWAAGNHNFQETLLMVAIDYTEERKHENAGKKAGLELEANDLKFEVEDVRNQLKNYREEMKQLETHASYTAMELGSEYEKKLERLQTEIKKEMDALLGIEEIQPKSVKLTDDIRKKLVGILSENPDDVSLNKISGGLSISAEKEIGDQIMETLGLELWKEADLPQNELEEKIFGLSIMALARENELTVKNYLKRMRGELEGLVVKTHLVAKLAMDACPDIFFKRSLAMDDAGTTWLSDFDLEKAAKADPRKILEAGKILGSMNGILQGNERMMKLQRDELSYARKTMKENFEGILEMDSGTASMYAPEFERIGGAVTKLIGITDRIKALTIQSAELVRGYRKNAVKYCQTARKLAEEKRKADALEEKSGKLEIYRKIILEIGARERRMDELAGFYFQLNRELKKMQEGRKIARLHRENSPKAAPEKKIKNDFAQPVKIEPTAIELEAKRRSLVEGEIKKIVKMALEHRKFREFGAKGKYSGMHKNFIETIGEFSRLYYEHGCRLGIQQAIDAPIFTNRAKNEGTNARRNSECTLLRLGMESKIKFRFIIDMSDPGSPIFLFAGTKDGSDSFLSEGKYEKEHETALADGRGNWFEGLKRLKNQ